MKEGDYAYVWKTSKDGESSMFRGVEVMIFLKKKTTKHLRKSKTAALNLLWQI